MAKRIKMLTVVTPIVRRNWKNLNIYIMYIMCSYSLLVNSVVNKNDNLEYWVVTKCRAKCKTFLYLTL